MSGKAKPSPEPFLLVMQLLGVSANETMLVGDSIRRDIVPAKALGMIAVHAAYGDRNFHEGEQVGADCVIHGIGEVIGVVGGVVCVRELTTNDTPVNKSVCSFPFFLE